MNHYREYLVTKSGCSVIEHDHGFLLYKQVNEIEMRITEIHVDPAYREKGIARDMADQVVAIAKEIGCKWMSCSTNLTGHDDRLSMLAILHYGFTPVQAHNNEIKYLKEI